MVLVLPMTTSDEIKAKNERFYYQLPQTYYGKTSRIILSQIKVLDKARFIEKKNTISWKDFNDIKKKLKAFLSL